MACPICPFASGAGAAGPRCGPEGGATRQCHAAIVLETPAYLISGVVSPEEAAALLCDARPERCGLWVAAARGLAEKRFYAWQQVINLLVCNGGLGRALRWLADHRSALTTPLANEVLRLTSIRIRRNIPPAKWWGFAPEHASKSRVKNFLTTCEDKTRTLGALALHPAFAESAAAAIVELESIIAAARWAQTCSPIRGAWIAAVVRTPGRK